MNRRFFGGMLAALVTLPLGRLLANDEVTVPIADGGFRPDEFHELVNHSWECGWRNYDQDHYTVLTLWFRTDNGFEERKSGATTRGWPKRRCTLHDAVFLERNEMHELRLWAHRTFGGALV